MKPFFFFLPSPSASAPPASAAASAFAFFFFLRTLRRIIMPATRPSRRMTVKKPIRKENMEKPPDFFSSASSLDSTSLSGSMTFPASSVFMVTSITGLPSSLVSPTTAVISPVSSSYLLPPVSLALLSSASASSSGEMALKVTGEPFPSTLTKPSPQLPLNLSCTICAAVLACI